MEDKPHSSQNTRRVCIKDSAVLKEQEGVFGIFLLWCGLFHESQHWQCLNKGHWSTQDWPLCPVELWPGDPHMRLWSARSSQVETDKYPDGRILHTETQNWILWQPLIRAVTAPASPTLEWGLTISDCWCHGSWPMDSQKEAGLCFAMVRIQNSHGDWPISIHRDLEQRCCSWVAG